MRDAKHVVELFWRTQDAGDYSALVALFAEDAVVVDPFYGTFTGREAIAGFMALMNTEMAGRQIAFRLVECSGGGDTAWAQWTALTPAGPIDGVGVYRVRDGLLTYYRDYMNAPRPAR
ncbi:MAG: nuclear transport factor 2 family protein [Gammaproteobacteria bacterium]